MTIHIPIWFLPFIFYFSFIGCIRIYRTYMRGEMHPISIVCTIPFLICFAVIDIIGNYALTIVMGWPPSGCYTISARLANYDSNDRGWRGVFARWFCSEFLNVFDQGHC